MPSEDAGRLLGDLLMVFGGLFVAGLVFLLLAWLGRRADRNDDTEI